jgi:hypothetical protein
MPAARRVYNGMLFARDPAAETSLVRGMQMRLPCLRQLASTSEDGDRSGDQSVVWVQNGLGIVLGFIAAVGTFAEGCLE